jgi:preprotein translocase subunit Sec61beta
MLVTVREYDPPITPELVVAVATALLLLVAE